MARYVKKLDRVGEMFTNNQGCKMEIVEYNSAKDVVVMFETGNIVHTSYTNIKSGSVKNYLYPSVYGVGYLGNMEYEPKLNKEAYSKWSGILERCYNLEHKKKYPEYNGCSVSEHWHNFQNFVKWFNDNNNFETSIKMEIDKDLFGNGTLIYSPETCSILPYEINYILKYINSNGWYKRDNGKYTVVFAGKTIGTYATVEEATHVRTYAYKEHIKHLIDKYNPLLTEKIINKLLEV